MSEEIYLHNYLQFTILLNGLEILQLSKRPLADRLVSDADPGDQSAKADHNRFDGWCSHELCRDIDDLGVCSLQDAHADRALAANYFKLPLARRGYAKRCA